jgi:hypothetical protein
MCFDRARTVEGALLGELHRGHGRVRFQLVEVLQTGIDRLEVGLEFFLRLAEPGQFLLELAHLGTGVGQDRPGAEARRQHADEVVALGVQGAVDGGRRQRRDGQLEGAVALGHINFTRDAGAVGVNGDGGDSAGRGLLLGRGRGDDRFRELDGRIGGRFFLGGRLGRPGRDCRQ